MFFGRLDELEPLTAANIHVHVRIRVLQRYQYDPRDFLVYKEWNRSALCDISEFSTWMPHNKPTEGPEI
jgi:hypothetical protein